MTSREIDTTRAGGTGDAAPKAVLGAPPMTYAEALEYHRKFDWRTIPGKGDQARRALIAEIERLNSVVANYDTALSAAGGFAEQICDLEAEIERLRAGNNELERRESSAWRQAYQIAAAELEKFRAALPGIIGCAFGEGIACQRDYYVWSPCCATRLRVVKARLIPAPDLHDEMGDGA